MSENQSRLSENPVLDIGAKTRILLIEDDPAHRILCQRSLSKDCSDYFVESTTTGQAALDRLTTANFDLVLLDYCLPDYNGLEMLKRINTIAPQTPVVMITCYDNEEFAVACLRAGASDYLPKTTNYFANLPRIIQTNLERQRLREELRQYQGRLTEKVKELETATEQLRLVNALIDQAHRERLNELSGLQEIYRIFNYATDLKRICRRLADRAAQLISAEKCSLALYDDKSNELLAQSPAYNANNKGAPKYRFKLDGASAAARVLKSGRAFIGNDLSTDVYYQKRAPAVHSLLVVPLRRHRRIIGFFYAVNKPGGFNDGDLRMLSIIANQVTIGLENARLFEQLRHFANTDELSGLANRRHFIDNLEFEIRRSQRNSRPFTLMLIDLDKLKLINDRFGHQTGDAAIRRIAEILIKNKRAMDLAARLGGDEFAVLLPETGKTRAQMVADRICRSVAGATIDPIDKITISIGYATYPFDSDSSKDLMRCADEALYVAKKDGRNRAIAYHQEVDAA